MEIYFSKLKNEFFLSDLKDLYEQSETWPVDAELVENSAWEQFRTSPNAQGKVRKVNPEGIIYWGDDEVHLEVMLAKERAWRDGELCRADIELYKVQDADPKAIGSVADWRQYRKDLRAWPENPQFPAVDNRPAAPDNI